jgi:outer membrane cobalamin receptor
MHGLPAFSRGVVLILPFLPWSGPVAANELLGEIIVRERQPAVADLSTEHVVDAPEIEWRNDRTLADVLELVPGINVRTGGQGIPRIDIRGLRTRQAKLLVNGVPFNSTFDGQYDPELIPAGEIARVKVTTVWSISSTAQRPAACAASSRRR